MTLRQDKIVVQLFLHFLNTWSKNC